MRIHNRFMLAILLPGIALLMSIMLLWTSHLYLNGLRGHIQYVSDLRSHNFVLVNLAQEFLLYRSPRVAEQLLVAYHHFGDQLGSPPKCHPIVCMTSNHSHANFSLIKNDHQTLGVFLPILLEESNLSGAVITGTMMAKFQDIENNIVQIKGYFEQKEEAYQKRSSLLLIGGGLLLLVILVLCLLPLYRRLFRGLNSLAAGARQIGIGDYNHRISETGTTELDLLAQEFNHMNVKLRESFETLAQTLNQQKIILNNTGLGVALLKDRKLAWVNPAMRSIFGIPVDQDLAGRSSAALYPDHESFLRFGEAAYPVLVRGATYAAEVRMLRQDGTPILCRLLGQAISPGHLEEGVIWVVEDITSRKAMEAEMIKVRNLAAIGILAGGVAHDFNNLFQALLGNITLARMVLPESSDAYQYLRKAEEAYQAGAKLTSRLIAFSSGGNPSPERCQLTALIQKEVNAQTAGVDIEVVFTLNDDLREVYCDPGQIEIVLQQLSRNAVEAMRHDGTLRVRAINTTVPEGAQSRLAPGDYVQISIQDQGCGISAENLPLIFDPYFSTKQMGSDKGQGLGLSLAEAIVRKHGGMIKVESDSEGATFRVFLPAAAELK